MIFSCFIITVDQKWKSCTLKKCEFVQVGLNYTFFSHFSPLSTRPYFNSQTYFHLSKIHNLHLSSSQLLTGQHFLPNQQSSSELHRQEASQHKSEIVRSNAFGFRSERWY